MVHGRRDARNVEEGTDLMNYEFDKEDAFRFSRHIGIGTRLKGDELIFNRCPYCGTSSSKEKFSINLRTGQFNCFRASCGAHGNMITLSRDFDFQISEDMDKYLNRNNYNGRFRKFAESHKESTDKAIKYLEGRGIPKEICQKYEITSKDGQENVIVFPFKNEHGDLKFIKYRNTEFQKGKDKSKEWCERDCMPILFGMNHCEGTEQLIITEGQIDSLSVAAAGVPNAVSVPTGALGSTWVPHCWEWVNQFDEIVVFGDCENGKITLTEMIQSRFSKKKIRIVEVEEYKGCKDANEILNTYGPNAIRDAIKNAATVLNRRIKEMADVEAVNLDTIPKIGTGFKILDKVLGGGFMYGQVIVLTGKRGNGKSTQASQFVCEALAQGHNALIYSGELPDFHVKAWIDGQLYGNTRLTNPQVCACERFYRGRLFIYSNQIVETDEFDDLLTVVEDTVVKKDIRFVLIDNLMTAITADQNEILYRKQSEFVGKLAKMAKAYNIVILLVAHPRKSKQEFENDDVSGSADITNRVDVVMSYDRIPEKEHPEENQRALKVTKNRLTGRLGSVDLFYSEDSKRISEDKENFRKDYLPEETGKFDDPDDMEQIPF